MLLSIAIPLGRLITEHHQATSFCGCAIGDGLRGAKRPEELPAAIWLGAKRGYLREDSDHWYQAAVKEWPWLTNHYLVPSNVEVSQIVYSFCFDPQNDMPYARAIDIISDYFFMVERGHIPLETLLDWIKANEPAEEVSGANGQLTAGNHQESCARNGNLEEVLASR
jgi:hypothetical protein